MISDAIAMHRCGDRSKRAKREFEKLREFESRELGKVGAFEILELGEDGDGGGTIFVSSPSGNANSFFHDLDKAVAFAAEVQDICLHLTGYWINKRAGNFRCYKCGCQFHTKELAKLPKGLKRDIEIWRGR